MKVEINTMYPTLPSMAALVDHVANTLPTVSRNEVLAVIQTTVNTVINQTTS